MHKKLESELISLAHSILKMKNKEDVFALKEQSKEIYEKLSMLWFVDEYLNTTPNAKESKEELIEALTTAFENKEQATQETALKSDEKNVSIKETSQKDKINTKDDLAVVEEGKVAEEEKPIVEKELSVTTEIIEQPFEDVEALLFNTSEEPDEPDTTEVIAQKEEENEPEVQNVQKTLSLEEELQDIISVDVMADLFENVQTTSLNDKLNTNIQIGLNDRIAFVKHLFNNQQEDYNRVVSQLNTFKTEKEAKNFINKMVKPDYNWQDQEELETRFLEIVTRRFS
ncbi:hypothetical protein [Polaribacter sp.]|uniref:hypothetical protein n=1 Tax=Polaribacter sp. TaxID=1920175 RepID=UPI003F69FC57